MTVNSLANFGVPGLNGDRSPVLQPIFQFKHRVLFYNFGTPGTVAPYDLTRQIQTVGRPKVSFPENKLNSYVSTVYVATRGEWNTITISFLDDITNSVMKRTEEQKAKQQNFFDQTVSRAGENYKFEMDLDILAGGATASRSSNDANIIQKWCYAGCWVTEFDYGDMDYKNTDNMTINLTIRYDNVIGFDENGLRLGRFSHTPEISSRSGVQSTGIGASGINISGATINVGVTGINVGGATASGNIRF